MPIRTENAQVAQQTPADIGQRRWLFSRVSNMAVGLDCNTPDVNLLDAASPNLDAMAFHSEVAETDDAIEVQDLALLSGEVQKVFVVDLGEDRHQLVLTTNFLYHYPLGVASVVMKAPVDADTASTGPFALNGTTAISPDWTVLSSSRWVVITNGVDTPFYYDGEYADYVPGLDANKANAHDLDAVDGSNYLFDSFTARIVASYYNLLFFMDTTEQRQGTDPETSLPYPKIRREYRVRRSDAGDPTRWAGGLSGRTDLLDLPDNIVAARTLGPYLIVYRRRSLIRAEWAGVGASLISFNTVVTIDGPLSHNAVAQIDDVHVFIGLSGVYIYRADAQTQIVSYPVHPELFAIDGPIDRAVRHEVYATTYITRRAIVFSLYRDIKDSNPSGPDIPAGTRLYILHIPKESQRAINWSRRILEGERYHVAGTYVNLAGEAFWRWRDLPPRAWNDLIQPWNRLRSVQSRYPVPVFVDRDDPEEAQRYTGAPGNIEWRYDTRSFGLDDKDLRLNTVLVLYQGTSICVEVVINRNTVQDEFPNPRRIHISSNSNRPVWLQFNVDRSCHEFKLVFCNPPGVASRARILNYGFTYNEESTLQGFLASYN